MQKNNWTREEHILAFNLYCKVPFTKINSSYPPIIELAKIIERSNGAVAMKLANFARLDPSLQARNISGLTRGAKGEEDVWNEFHGNWDNLAWQSELLLSKYKNTTIEQLYDISKKELPKEGKIREQLVKVRVNQSFFRSSILASYNNSCCITGINNSELLIAGHIKPWSSDEKNRLNPRNGIAINALHDKAFENGLITITPDYKIKISKVLFNQKKTDVLEKYFFQYENKDILLPSKFLPDVEFLKYHNEQRFQR